MRHLTPEQFVDVAEGTRPESAIPHLASCDACRLELAGLRAMMAETADEVAGHDGVPEPSPLFWNQLSSRVRNAVAEEPRGLTSWFGWLRQPRVFVPSLAAALAVTLVAVLIPRAPVETIIPATALPIAQTSLPSVSPSLPPLAPLGAADDPELRIVAAVATAVDWDEMRDEVALASTGTGDAIVASLTIDEQRELQRLLAQEMAQSGTPEKRS
jgi:hypothetical protein